MRKNTNKNNESNIRERILTKKTSQTYEKEYQQKKTSQTWERMLKKTSQTYEKEC